MPAILRLHGSWDTPAARDWCMTLQQRLAGVEPFYRGRNSLSVLDGPTGLVVVKAFGNRRWYSLQRNLGKAVASYDNGVRALRATVGTPEPRAAIAATGTGGFYVCDHAPGCASVWDIHDRRLGEDALEGLAAFVAHMHDAGVDHRDLTPGNILLRPAGRGYEHLLVDLNRMTFGPVSLARGLAALAKLECEGRLVAPYAAARKADPQLAQRLYARGRWLEHTTRTLKDATRPWRRKMGL